MVSTGISLEAGSSRGDSSNSCDGGNCYSRSETEAAAATALAAGRGWSFREAGHAAAAGATATATMAATATAATAAEVEGRPFSEEGHTGRRTHDGGDCSGGSNSSKRNG